MKKRTKNGIEGMDRTREELGEYREEKVGKTIWGEDRERNEEGDN